MGENESEAEPNTRISLIIRQHIDMLVPAPPNGSYALHIAMYVSVGKRYTWERCLICRGKRFSYMRRKSLLMWARGQQICSNCAAHAACYASYII